jgi:hypothetical protein
VKRLALLAIEALLTDPVTGDWLDDRDIRSLGHGLVVTIGVIVAMLAASLGLGAGQ